MKEISEPLPQSKIRFGAIHEVSDGKRTGHVEVEYVQKDIINNFRKYTKRKPFIGQPYGTRIFIDKRGIDATANELGKSTLLEIITALKERIKGLQAS